MGKLPASPLHPQFAAAPAEERPVAGPARNRGVRAARFRAGPASGSLPRMTGGSLVGVLRRAAAFGALAWVVLLALGLFVLRAEALVALGAAVVVPLGLALVIERRTPALAVAVAAPGALASLALGPGTAAAALAAPWCVATLLVALEGARRLLRRGAAPLEELAIDAGMIYLPVGAIWLLASRAGVPLLGFQEPVVLYTAAHFHFAGFATPLIAGVLGRELDLRRAPSGVRRAYGAACGVVIAAIPLVAAGITLGRALEAPAAVLLGAGMLVLAALLVRTGATWIRRRQRAGVLLAIAGLSLVFSMALAIVFTTTGSATRGAGVPWIPFTTMATLHGAANALGFSVSALAAFTLAPPPARVSGAEPAWPRFRVHGFVGPDVFDRLGAVDAAREAHGQLDDLAAFASSSFDPARVHPSVRAFYEQSGAWAMQVTPTWHAPFGLAARLFVGFARRALGQLELPVDATRGAGDRIETRTLALVPDFDGREGARGYVRVAHARDGGAARAIFVASYAICRGARAVFLSPAFPLPLGFVLVAMLRFDDGPEPGSLVLSSRTRPGDDPAEEGMLLITPMGPVRLPMHESITVRPAGRSATATHDVRLLGLRVFTFEYLLVPRDSAPDRNPA